jgi:hypothetical protein
MAKNTRAKRRDVENPYETYFMGKWVWKVLKHYKAAEGERKDPYARVFCAVQSPYTGTSYDLGDVYCKSIPGYNWDWSE